MESNPTESNPMESNQSFPKIILIKRGSRQLLINDNNFQMLDKFKTSGKERREIEKIDQVDTYLHKIYGNNYKSLYFENMPFDKQVNYFKNADIIICAHGAVMANMFFCKENAKIIEITFKGKKWEYFDEMSKILKLNHIKCPNCYEKIIRCINNNKINKFD